MVNRAPVCAVGALAAALTLVRTPALAQTSAEGTKAGRPSPVERADELPWKATLSGYLLKDDEAVDLNLRRRIGHLMAWAGAFVDKGGPDQGRVGAEYDFQRGPFLAIPTVNVGTNGLLAGSFYAEVGSRFYGIGGYAITNLKSFYNLSFDPNDSVELGAGWHVSPYDRLAAFSIFDVRLHTGQQDTHLLWRHKLDPREGITLDALYKSGHDDTGRYVRALGLGVYYDHARFFLKGYFDPHVNFSTENMVRLGMDWKF